MVVSGFKHRFQSGMCEADLALQHLEPLDQNPFEVQIVTKWPRAKIISNGFMRWIAVWMRVAGFILVCCTLK
jgi:hypothetical protein